MAVVATQPFPGSRRADAGTWVRSAPPCLHIGGPGTGQLLFDGYFYRDVGLGPEDMLADFRRGAYPAKFARFKGQYAAIYVAPAGQALRAIQDHAGHCEIYERCVDGARFLATNFLDLCKALTMTEADLDRTAAAEFRMVGCAIGERTLIRGARRLPPGAILSADHRGIVLDYMWHYRRDHADRFDADVAAEALDETLERAAWRALQSSPGPRVAIGISGGLDSRVAAWYLKRAGADLTGYFFGEVGTEAHRAASDVASTLCIPLVALGCNRTLPHYFSRLLEARPLANLEWAKYATGRHKVDETDAIASGHLGDLLFGSHLGDPLFGGVVTPPGGESDAALARFTLTQMFADDCPPDVRTIVEGETAALCREVGGSALQRISAVWYRSRSMSIKNAPLFHDFDVRPHLAIFADIDVINLCLRLPRPALIGKGFYKQFIARRMPEVSPERVIPPVQRTHKPIESWLLDNSTFAQAVRCLAPTPRNGVRLNGTARHLHEAADAIIAGAVNRQEIHRFFRAFTIEAFVERWLSS